MHVIWRELVFYCACAISECWILPIFFSPAILASLLDLSRQAMNFFEVCKFQETIPIPTLHSVSDEEIGAFCTFSKACIITKSYHITISDVKLSPKIIRQQEQVTSSLKKVPLVLFNFIYKLRILSPKKCAAIIFQKYWLIWKAGFSLAITVVQARSCCTSLVKY